MERVFLYPVNGFLALIYVALENWALLVTAGAIFSLVAPAPKAQRLWVLGLLAPALPAAVLVPAPVPLIIAAMCAAGALFVRLDRFNPEGLRWRAAGGIALYSAAALGFALYLSYVSRLNPVEWARLVGSVDEAAGLVASGRSFIHTLGIWGVWLIIPLGYFSLLLQGFLVHPPVPASPEQVVWRVRERRGETEAGEEEEIF